MSTYKTEGFVLKKKALGEADRLYSIFTLDHGKIEAVADGSAKITSKLAGNLEPFNICQLMIANGKYFERIAGAKIINKFDYLTADWSTLTLVWVLSEGLNNLTIGHLPEPEIYNLLKKLLNYLNQELEREEKIFQIIQFFWLVFLIMGQRQLVKINQGTLFFNKIAGNFIEQKDQTELQKIEKNYLAISPELLNLLKEIDQFYQRKKGLFSPTKINKELLKNFYYLFINNYQLLTNQKLKAFQFLSYV